MLPVLALSGATVQICSTWNSTACTGLLQTYQSATVSGPNQCPTSAQLYNALASACSSTADVSGGFGIWTLPGSYAYFVTTSYGTFGPYPFGVDAGGAYCPATGCFAPNIPLSPLQYGAKGGAIICDPTGQMPKTNCAGSGAISTTTLTVTGAAPFNATTDVGKAIVIGGCGTPSGGRTYDLATTIATVVSTSQVTTAASCQNSEAATWFAFGYDDTAGLATCTYDATNAGTVCDGNGNLFMFSPASTTTTLEMVGSQGVVQHMGIIFAPRWSIPAGQGSIFFSTANFGTPEPITGPIASGATSFTVPSAGDASGLTAGQWLMIFDNPTSGIVGYTDFMQVASVSGTTVNIQGAFRMAFPNTVAFSSSPCCTGLGFYPLSSVPQNITLRDIAMIVPNVEGYLGGLSTQGTIGITQDNVTCWDSSEKCRSLNYDKNATTVNSTILETDASEYTNSVGSIISHNHWLCYPNLFDQYQTPALPAGGPSISYGSGFGVLTANVMDCPYSAGVLGYDGAHDWTISGNTFGVSALTGSHGYTQIFLSGGYRNVIGPNDLTAGSLGTSTTGIGLQDDTEGGYLFVSQNNAVIGNQVTTTGFTTPFSSTGSASSTNAFCNPIAGVWTCAGSTSAALVTGGSITTPTLTQFAAYGNPGAGMQNCMVGPNTTITNCVGSIFSSGAVFLSYNAGQALLGTDSWTQYFASDPSSMLAHDPINGVVFYTAAASSGNNPLASFWTKRFQVTPLGAIGGKLLTLYPGGIIGGAASATFDASSVTGPITITIPNTSFTLGAPVPVRAGSWTIAAGNTTVAVTFATPLSGTPNYCLATPTGDSTTPGAPWASSLATTGFTVNVHTTGGLSGTYACGFNNAF
jgi:hypothetical protein